MSDAPAGRRRFVLVLGCMTGLAAVSIDMSLPAIPEMVRSLITSMSVGQQIVGVFMAGIALGQLPAGLLSDRLGRLPVLYFGLTLFTLAGVVSSFADHIGFMLLARFLQGLSASVGLVIARAIVRDVASGADAARMMSVMVMIFTAAPMLAPVVGAWLVDGWGWRMPFVAITACGALLLGAVPLTLHETHVPAREHHLLRQLYLSIREFFSHRRSVFGVLLVALTAGGFMPLITGSSALVIEIYGFPVRSFGFIFALAGASILAGSIVNRRLLIRFSPMFVIGVGAAVIGAAGAQMLIVAWLGQAPFWWVWGNACLFMFGTGFLLPNATALALDPVPNIAGVSASIIGTIQNIASSGSAIASGLAYDGTVRNIVVNMGGFGVATLVLWLARSWIIGDRTKSTG